MDTVKTVEDLLPVDKLRELFDDGSSRYWLDGPTFGERNYGAIWDVFDAGAERGGEVRINVEAERDITKIEETGTFSIEKFRAAIVQVAVERFLDQYGSENIDEAVQLAVFGKLIYG